MRDVLCVIDCRTGDGDVAATLRSVAAVGWEAVLLGCKSPPYSDSGSIREAEELADCLAADEKRWLCALSPGDLLSSRAAEAYGAFGRGRHEATVLYGDDDLTDSRGRRHSPHFKPDWNAELFAHHDYLSGSCLLRVGRGDLADLPKEGWEKALLTRLLRSGEAPAHVSQITHHRRARPAATVPIERLQFATAKRPKVSIIIPTRDQADLLSMCLEGVRAVDYGEVEITIVDNGSEAADALALLREAEQHGANVLRLPGPFNFSALNNQAVSRTTGDLICFLNNDVEMPATDWLETLAVQAMRTDVGAVGPRLLYPDGTIQHAGVVIGMGEAAGHAHRGEQPDGPGYFDRARLPQYVSAVTAACLVVSRAKFDAVGMFDEKAFPVAFNDVDLCLKLNQRGWQSLYEPRATLVHHESKSRGQDRDAEGRVRFARELTALQARWLTDKVRDPFHHRHLSRATTSFILDL
ncbi:glycosyltransferase family 2 protein [Sphingomonas kaistensis]|uniref:Glycosyltransferase family 2 protein n=1 Tax=Sphingomonas kaistensis TaxID=298708 RepID=A0ABZ2G0B0_9SPHN